MLSDAEFRDVRDLIYEQSGINFTDNNRSILESRLRQRLKVAELERVTEYLQLIRSDQAEMRSLLDSVTTNLTRFFRNAAHVATLADVVVPTLAESGVPRVLHAWSAGCSTGEEAFTIAMLLAEHLPRGWSFDVVGSDISLTSLMIANAGFYATDKTSGVPDRYLKKYFERNPDGYQIGAQIKRGVRFDYSNLMHDSGLREMDIIMCRNVLIYFDAAAQQRVVARLFDAMSPDGFLFIGHSESLFGMDSGFEYFKTKSAVIYRKRRAVGDGAGS